MSSYPNDYRTLGTEPGCTLSTLKSARRRMVKSWHPDRFPPGRERHVAEEKIKEINTAFDRLIDYHKSYGALPSSSAIDADRSTSSYRADKSPTELRSTSYASTSAASSTDPVRSASTPPTRSYFRLTLGFTVVLGLFAAMIELVQNSTKDSQTFNVTVPDVAQKPLEPLPETEQAQETPRTTDNSYFTVGSRIGDVYAIQGIPTATENNVWHYGKSKVFFVDGVVTSWIHDPTDPLKVTILSDTQKPRVQTFTIGSTKAEVRAVQGAPLIETESVWDYGLSKVHFKDGLVIGWNSSPMRPLKARK
jgi:hypothetical protein